MTVKDTSPIVVIDDKKKAAIFKALTNKSYTEVGYLFGLDKRWPNPITMRMNISRIKGEVLNDPAKFGISADIVEIVEKAIIERKAAPATNFDVQIESQQALIDASDIKGMSIKGRDKAAALLHKKMDMLGKSKKALDKESIVNLAKVFATFFDKAQIVMGQATEHIAVLSKVKDGMTPEESMEMLLKMREVTVAEKEK